MMKIDLLASKPWSFNAESVQLFESVVFASSLHNRQTEWDTERADKDWQLGHGGGTYCKAVSCVRFSGFLAPAGLRPGVLQHSAAAESTEMHTRLVEHPV
jgi:hypothetical protein